MPLPGFGAERQGLINSGYGVEPHMCNSCGVEKGRTQYRLLCAYLCSVRRRAFFHLGSHPPAPFRHNYMSAKKVLRPEGENVYFNIQGAVPLEPQNRLEYLA